ncbi:MAG: glycoside hydrolase family 2 protein [Lentisphaeria bacterium]|jgi:beta-galactosidase
MKKTLVLLFGLLVAAAVAAPSAYVPPRHNFQRVPVIAPSAVTVNVAGQELRPAAFTERRSLNGKWKISGLVNAAGPFAADNDLTSGYERPDFDDSGWDDIAVPLDWFRHYRQAYKRDQPYVKGWYRRQLELNAEDLADRRVILHFERIGYEALIFVNGRQVGQHKGDFTEYEVDVTEALQPGTNSLALRVLTDFGPAFGRREPVTHAYGSQWSMSNIRGGIWGNVTLRLEPLLRIEKLLIDPLPRCPGHEQERHELRASYVVQNYSGVTTDIRLVGVVSSAMQADANLANPAQLSQRIADWNAVEYKTLAEQPNAHSGQLHMVLDDTPPVQLWHVDRPYLYFFTLLVLDGNDRVLAARSERFGFRRFEVREGKFYLNGEEIYLFGENIPSPSYGGFPESAEELEARLTESIQNERNNGYVIIRNSHMPIVPIALTIADELGMMIFNEWAWCFTVAIDEKPFGEQNLREIRQFVVDSYNYPSVCMWSMGNEVRHAARPDVWRQLNAQVALVRELDGQRRPISNFSGAAGWGSYGRDPLDTDVLDLHTYVALASPWTLRDRQSEAIYQGLLEIYGEQERLSRPLVAWENIGFSWGWKTDKTFRVGNAEDYLKYAKADTKWAQPNGIGFTGAIGLSEALLPGMSPAMPMNLYGRRILELYRLDRRYTGFAPWFNIDTLECAPLWNQPVLPTLHSERNFPPRHLYAGESSDWLCEVVNSSNQVYSELVLTGELVGPTDDDRQPVGTWLVPALPAQANSVNPARLELPMAPAGSYQLRLTLRDSAGQRIGQNYYDITLQQRAELTRPISARRSVAVLDNGVATNVNALCARLDAFGISYRLATDPNALAAGTVLVLPPEIAPQVIGPELTKALERFVNNGGILLALEQQNPASKLPGAYSLALGDTSFCDMVLPDHPVFAGMTLRHLDTWDDGELCMVVRAAYTPFTVNAVAARGPRLGQKNAGMALVEGSYGRGRVIYSQLAAFAAAERDSAAALFLRNLFNYVFAGEEWWPKSYELVPAQPVGYVVKPERTQSIDIRAAANRSFSDDEDGDGKGGWTDQGENDFRMMPLGNKVLAGVPFTILDPATNDDKSCIVLAGTERPDFPLAAKGIALGGCFSRLFFLHTAAWGAADKVGCYRMHYADGSTAELPLRGNHNIGDWWDNAPLTDAITGLSEKNPLGQRVSLYVTEWENPRPAEPLVALDFLSPLYNDKHDVDYLPGRTGVPVLVAVTAETAHPKRYDILADYYEGHAGVKDIGSETKGAVTEIELDGRRAWQVDFPAVPAGDVPVVFFRFALNQAALAEHYDYLTLRIKSDSAASMFVSLPEKSWKLTLAGNLTLQGDGEFRSYRLRIGEDMRASAHFSYQTMRGELFFYYKVRGANTRARDALRFIIDSAVLE